MLGDPPNRTVFSSSVTAFQDHQDFQAPIDDMVLRLPVCETGPSEGDRWRVDARATRGPGQGLVAGHGIDTPMSPVFVTQIRIITIA